MTGLDSTTLTYDYYTTTNKGRLKTVSHSAKGTLASYTYDTRGRVETVTDAKNNTYTYGYDETARTVRK